MLILTRRVGETLMIGDEITATVLGVKGNQMRIDIQAPQEVSVHRHEVYKRIQEERGREPEQIDFGANNNNMGISTMKLARRQSND